MADLMMPENRPSQHPPYIRDLPSEGGSRELGGRRRPRSASACSSGTLPSGTQVEDTVVRQLSPNTESLSVLSSADGEIVISGGTLNAVKGNQNYFTVQVHLNEIFPVGEGDQTVGKPPIPVKSGRPEPLLPTSSPDVSLKKEGCSCSLQSHPLQLAITEQSINDVYYRLLSSKQRGSPLWIPGTNKRLPIEYRRHGLGIGDVGIITERGFFDSLFNISLPRDHPLAINSDRLPDNFYPLNITPNDIQEYSEFNQGSYLSSASIKSSYKDDNSSGLTFESSASEGAILTLPDGSNSEDLGNKKKLQDYLSVHGEDMYRCALNQHGRIIRNGDLRVVSGYDKTTNWGMAAFSNSTGEPDSESFRLKFRPRDPGVGRRTPSWESSGTAEVKAGPDMREVLALQNSDPSQQHVEYENQTVFVRTENITLSKETWNKLLSESGTGDIELDKENSSHSTSSNSTQFSQPRGSSNNSSSSTSENHYSGPSGGSWSSSHSSLPNTLTVHPSNGINEMLLKLKPNARMAITGDEYWISVLRKEDSVLPPIEQMWARIEKHFIVREKDGVVFLERNEIEKSMNAYYPPIDSTNSAKTRCPSIVLESPTGSGSHSQPHNINPKSSSANANATVIGCVSPVEVLRLGSLDTSPSQTMASASNVPNFLMGLKSHPRSAAPLLSKTDIDPLPTWTGDLNKLPGYAPFTQAIPTRPLSRAPSLQSEHSSVVSQPIEHVLAPRDIVGDGFFLQGEPIRLVSNRAPDHGHREPANELQVIKQLGVGRHAVVYQVQEVLSHVPSDDGHVSTISIMQFDNESAPPAQTVYGRKYALKCLSKANLDQDALDVQMSEVTIHQSLQLHPNIVTLYRTLETSAFLLLLLEYVPGEDLFYFLEQSRDNCDFDNTNSSVTLPTPTSLSNLHPSHLLSRSRLRLISSMFRQMCEAVAACHAQQTFHRDIKPENFIVTDGTDGSSLECKFIIKLTDFGLSTTDLESADMDCGSAPYMSYECRNDVAPSYRPRAADVWSLGIVLINMLYHVNPWTDTAQGACSLFALYLEDPISFFTERFIGMTKPVAEVLASKVFCILPAPQSDSPRMSAVEFGDWAKNLPTFLGGHSVHQTMSNDATIEIEGMTSRSKFIHKRRKRGARKGATATSPPTAQDNTLLTLAIASESLAQEITKTSRSSQQSTSSPTSLTKKPSKWKLSFGKKSASALTNVAAIGRVSPVEEAGNVSSLLMGLNLPVSSSASLPQSTHALSPQLPNRLPGSDILSASPPRADHWSFHDHSASPNSTRSGGSIRSSASSNWRSSMSTSSSTGTSASAFTRYSNSSTSISTTATSFSSKGWRTSVKPSSTISSSTGYQHGNIPRNIKIMDGVPWEVDELPRFNGEHKIFDSPPVRRHRKKQPQAQELDTITECTAGQAINKSHQNLHQHAAPSTTDLSTHSIMDEFGEGGVKKVQKGQINALSKMLSALRR